MQCQGIIGGVSCRRTVYELKSEIPDDMQGDTKMTDNQEQQCPYGHGPLKESQGKQKCETCGWPEKKDMSGSRQRSSSAIPFSGIVLLGVFVLIYAFARQVDKNSSIQKVADPFREHLQEYDRFSKDEWDAFWRKRTEMGEYIAKYGADYPQRNIQGKILPFDVRTKTLHEIILKHPDERCWAKNPYEVSCIAYLKNKSFEIHNPGYITRANGFEVVIIDVRTGEMIDCFVLSGGERQNVGFERLEPTEYPYSSLVWYFNTMTEQTR